MYERFTERARGIMTQAREEANSLRHEYLGTEHILLSLAVEVGGIAGHVLREMGADASTIRHEIT